MLFATNVRLRIERGGEALVSGRVLDRESGGPTASAPTGLSVRDLDGDGEPEVVLDLHRGGAHCCTVSRIHRLEPDGASYAASEYDWGNYGYELRDIEGDGVPEFVGVDDRFAYVFAPFAATSSPVRVWRLVRGGLSDVTSDQPELIRADARRWWRAYRSERRRPLARRADLRGILAAWQADKVQLGEAAHGWKVLRAARRRGELRGPEPWPSGRRYLTHVRTFLARKGYVR
ncbi:MAG: hypothetical protein ACE5EV_03020 [Gaiellales bacterium]